MLKGKEFQVRPGDVHFTKEGYRFLAEKVTKEIQRALSETK